MPGPLEDLLAALRSQRGFDAEQVLAAKVGRIAGWFRAEGLDAAVIGVSGGVDSAVALGLLARVAAIADGPLRRLVALSLPISGLGSTGQTDASGRGRKVAAAFGVELWDVPLGESHASILAALATGSGHRLDGWAAGQLLAVERTPALYGAAALLQAQGHRSVVVGTTNRDEGAYLGFFGKASDAMVDLQPISDLHKAEVVALARLLGVPDEVVDAPPSGDVFDGRADAEMIGASYDEVELVLRLRELGRDPHVLAEHLLADQHLADQQLADHAGDRARLGAAADAVEELHRHNRHKYAVGSPAVHLDVLPRGVPGGWPDEVLSGRDEHPPADVPGAWEGPDLALPPAAGLPDVEPLDGALLVHRVLSPAECRALAAALDRTALAPVGVTGSVHGADLRAIGSLRATAFAPALAADLWQRLRPAVPTVRFLDEHTPTDAILPGQPSGARSWQVVGLSPVLRFMRYEPGGRHLGHYDAAYDYGDGRRTLSSVVWFLTGDGDPAPGGATRFLADGQHHLPTAARCHDDWARDARPDEVLLAVPPQAGAALVFDHRRCHDVEAWRGAGPRVVIRADVVYEAIPDGRLVTAAPG